MATETSLISEAERDAAKLADRAEERSRELNASVAAANAEIVTLRGVVHAQADAITNLETRLAAITAKEPSILLARVGALLGVDLVERPVENLGSMPGLRGARR